MSIQEENMSGYSKTSIVQINLSKGIVENVFENFNEILKIHRTFNIREIIKCLK